LNAGSRLVVIQGEYTDITQSEKNHLQDYEYWSSQLGLVYKYSDHYSWFGSYSEALKANYHLDDVGSASIDPELSNQFELGVKTLLNNGRFLSSVALFQINKDNVVDHVIDQGLRTSLGLYSMRARGVDMDFTWQIDPRWDLMGAMSIQSTEILDGPYAGERSNMAADQIVSLFVHHQFNQRLAFNLGMNYVSERESQNRLISAVSQIDELADDFKMSAYATADFSAVYELHLFNTDSTVKLLIKNLTDTEYYSATAAGTRENFAEGRFFQLSFEAGF
jgi:iron complex outermembrane recepter protein